MTLDEDNSPINTERDWNPVWQNILDKQFGSPKDMDDAINAALPYIKQIVFGQMSGMDKDEGYGGKEAVVDDVAMKLVLHLRKIKDGGQSFANIGSVINWLKLVAKSTALDLIDLREYKLSSASLSFDNTLFKKKEDMEQDLLTTYLAKQVEFSFPTWMREFISHFPLDSLSDTRRQTLLHRLNGVEYDDIAGILELPTGTVKSGRNRACKMLYKKLASIGVLTENELIEIFYSGIHPSSLSADIINSAPHKGGRKHMRDSKPLTDNPSKMPRSNFLNSLDPIRSLEDSNMKTTSQRLANTRRKTLLSNGKRCLAIFVQIVLNPKP